MFMTGFRKEIIQKKRTIRNLTGIAFDYAFRTNLRDPANSSSREKETHKDFKEKRLSMLILKRNLTNKINKNDFSI